MSNAAKPLSPPVAPRCGVILCNFNDAETLPRALDAILTQSRPPDEFVVVDDGSTDGSARILAEYAARYRKLRLLINDRNRGLIYSTQRALGALTAEYIYSGSANDHVLPGFFQRAMDLLQANPSADLAFGCVVYKDRVTGKESPLTVHGWDRDGFRPPAEFRRDYLDRGEMWASLGPSCVYRRQAMLDAGGYDPELDAFGDTFVSNYLGLNHGVCYVHEPCVVYFTGGGAFSQQLYGNPSRLIAVIHHAIVRMRERPDVFPADYVAQWKHSRLESVLNHQCSQLRDHVWQARTVVEAAKPGGQWLSAGFVRLLGSLLIRLGESHIRRAGRPPRATTR